MTLKEIDKFFVDLENKNDKIRYPAFLKLMEITDKKVKWIYDKWFVLYEKLSSANSFVRNIGLILLANLAKSDYENRLEKIIDEYLEFFEDEKFVTSRLCIQNVWRIAVADKRLKGKIIGKLEESYFENAFLKIHPNLIRLDIISSLMKIYNTTKEQKTFDLIQTLINEETDLKSKKAMEKTVVEQNNKAKTERRMAYQK